MNRWLLEAAERLENDLPDVWSVVYPHRILAPSGYVSPKYYSLNIAGHLQMMRELNPSTPSAHGAVILSSLNLVNHGVPTYFVEDAFAEAVTHLKLPRGVTFSEIQWPLPAMLIVLPEQFSRRHFGWHIPHITLNRVPKGIYPSRKDFPLLIGRLGIDLSQARPMDTEFDRIVVAASVHPDKDVAPIDYTGDYPLHHKVEVIESSPFRDATPYEREKFGVDHYDRTGLPDDHEDRKISDKIMYFAVRLLLSLSARPTLVRNGTIQRPAKEKRGRIRPALWNPSMIGVGYRVARQGPVSPEGTHASPRLHWRWGHWTHQVIGKRGQPGFISTAELPRTQDGEIDWANVPEDRRAAFWKCHKLIMIDPILINAPDDENQPAI